MPIYTQKKTIDGIEYIKTYEPNVYIESITGDIDTPRCEIIYKNFQDEKRWKITGSCNACGLGNLNAVDREGKYIIAEGKKMGEANSTYDTDYDTRLDIPITPDAIPDFQQEARDLGVTYGCGLIGEWLNYE